MPNEKDVLEPLDRSITAQEAELVRWLTEHGEPGSEQLLNQIDDLKVVSECKCGCPTVYFAMGTDGNSRKGERLVSDWIAKVGEEIFGVMLFKVDGKISSLEVYCCSGRVEEFGLPPIETILGYDERSVDRLVSAPFQ
jgi:hypothetical protein